VLAALLLLLVPVACVPEPDVEVTGVRNLLIVCFDTVRFDSFRAAIPNDPRDPRGKWTPNALRFGNALAPAPWTVPSVASVLTGRDPLNHGAGVFKSPVANLDNEVPSGISPDVPTLAELLGDRGYETVAFVAHPWFESGYGLERGFQSLTLEKERQHLGAKAQKWLSWRTSREDPPPFFMYLHLMDSHRHLSWTFEQRRRRERFLLQRSADLAAAGAPGGICDDRKAESCGQYLAYVRSIAEQLEALARVFEVLEESGQLEQTAVVLYSDHGEEFGDHAQVRQARGADPRGIYGLGHGQSLYQELLHVPLWMWHPDHEGRELLGPVSLLDVMPTALDWLGIQIEQPLDGRSLAPWVAGAAAPPEIARPLFATRIAYGPEQISLLRLPWKRIVQPGGGELFFLPEDPHETAPREDPTVAAELDAQIDAWLAREAATPAPPPQLTREQIERLQSLGYLEGAQPKDD
jgi:arylsulfatase A-like enzyme